MNQQKIKILAINDGRQGHFNQILGVLNYLPFKYEVINLKANKIGKLPNELIIYNALGISNFSKQEFKAKFKGNFPVIILSAGRKSFAFARYIKKQALKNGKKTLLCQFMFPGYKSKDANLIFVSNKEHLKNNKNAIYKTLVANNVNQATLQKSSTQLQELLNNNNLKKPYISLMLGGNYKNKVVYSKEDAKNMAQSLAQKLTNNQTLLISTSRRTPKEFTQTFYKECKKHLKNFYFYNFNDNNLNFNPYYGFFNIASDIIITYDSVSMISEACSLNKNTPIWIYDNFMVKYNKFNLYKKLQNKGYVNNFSLMGGKIIKKVNIPNYTKQIAEDILTKYNEIF